MLVEKRFKDEIDDLAKELGRTFSDVVQEGLDQWAKIQRDELGPSHKKKT